MTHDEQADISALLTMLISENLDQAEKVKAAGFFTRWYHLRKLLKQKELICETFAKLPRDLMAALRLQWITMSLGHLTKPPQVEDSSWDLMMRVAKFMVRFETNDYIAHMNKHLVESGAAEAINDSIQQAKPRVRS